MKSTYINCHKNNRLIFYKTLFKNVHNYTFSMHVIRDDIKQHEIHFESFIMLLSEKK